MEREVSTELLYSKEDLQDTGYQRPCHCQGHFALQQGISGWEIPREGHICPTRSGGGGRLEDVSFCFVLSQPSVPSPLHNDFPDSFLLC